MFNSMLGMLSGGSPSSNRVQSNAQAASGSLNPTSTASSTDYAMQHPSNGAQASINGSVTAGGNISVTANGNIGFQSTVGSVVLGFVGVGGSIAIATVNANTQATLNGSASAGANSNINVAANQSDNVNGTAYAGTIGISDALGAQVIDMQDGSSAIATVNAAIPQAGSLTVQATGNLSVNANSSAVTAGEIAIGLGIALAKANGTTEAEITGGQIGQGSGQSVGGINVSATNIDNVTAATKALAGGVGAFGANYAEADDNPTDTASIGGTITSSGAISVTAQATPDANADTEGLALGAVAGGASGSQANPAPTNPAYISAGNDLRPMACSVRPESEVQEDQGNSPTAYAHANASGGGLGAFNDAEPNAIASPNVDAYASGNVTASQDVSIQAFANGSASADADGVTVAGLAIGNEDVTAAIESAQTKAYASNGVILNAGHNVTINASSSQNPVANASVTAGGVIAGAGQSTTAIRNDPVTASSGDNTTISAGNSVAITAENATTNASATSNNGSGGLAAAGVPDAFVTVNDSTTASLGNSANVTATAGSFTLQATTSDLGAKADAEAFSAGFIAVVVGTAITTLNDPASTNLGNSTVTAGTNIVIGSTVNDSSAAVANLFAGGFGAASSGTASNTDSDNATTSVAPAPSLTPPRRCRCSRLRRRDKT